MPRPAATPAPNPLALMADELGDLEKELAPLQPKIKRVESLRKLLRAAAGDDKPDSMVKIEGTRFIVLLGACASERRVDIIKLAKLIGAKAFVKIASVTLKTLEASVSPGVIAAVVKTAATGTRPIETLEKGAPPPTVAKAA